MSSARDYYDVVVMGEGLPLLAAGLTVARGGTRVFLAPIDNSLSPSANSCDATGPFIEGVQLITFLRVLGLAPAEIRDVKRKQPAFQIIFPNQRVELAREEESWHREFAREYPGLTKERIHDWSALSREGERRSHQLLQQLRAFSILPPRGWRNKLQNRKALAGLRGVLRTASFHNEFWERVVRFLRITMMNGLCQQANPEREAALSHSEAEYLMTIARWGSFHARALPSRLREHLSKRGVPFLQRGTVDKMVHHGREVTELGISDGDVEKIRCKHLIFAGDPKKLAPFIDDRRTLDWIESQEVLYDRYLLPITLLNEGVPVGLAERSLVVQDTEAPPDRGNLLQMDLEKREEGKTTLWTRFVLPHKTPLDDEAIKTVLSRVTTIIPFLNENQTPPFLPVRPCGSVYKLNNGGTFPLRGTAPVTPLKNLFVAGPTNLPEMGIEGEILSAIKTSQLVLSQGRKFAGQHLALQTSAMSC